MVPSLVTHSEARYQLRLEEPDSNYDDPNTPWLDTWIPAVSAAVASWLKDEWRLYVPEQDSNGILVDSNGDPIPSTTVQPQVKAAVLIELASQFRFREGEGDNRVDQAEGHGYVLNKTSTALLVSIRKSTVA